MRRGAGLVRRAGAQGDEHRLEVVFLTRSRGKVFLEKAAAYGKLGAGRGQVHSGE